jgi:hypothetical protein
VLLDCRNSFPLFDNKNMALQRLHSRELLELIHTVDALYPAGALMGNALLVLTSFALA